MITFMSGILAMMHGCFLQLIREADLGSSQHHYCQDTKSPVAQYFRFAFGWFVSHLKQLSIVGLLDPGSSLADDDCGLFELRYGWGAVRWVGHGHTFT